MAHVEFAQILSVLIGEELAAPIQKVYLPGWIHPVCGTVSMRELCYADLRIAEFDESQPAQIFCAAANYSESHSGTTIDELLRLVENAGRKMSA